MHEHDTRIVGASARAVSSNPLLGEPDSVRASDPPDAGGGQGERREQSRLQGKSFSIQIEPAVFTLGLTPYEFTVYCHIKRQENEGVNSTSNLRWMSKKAGVSPAKFAQCRDRLIDFGLLQKPQAVSAEKAIRVLTCKDKSEDGQRSKCEWCGYLVFAIQEHHYPVPRCKGGTETVAICGTCHADFHWLVGSEY
jgi:hypothetical protein